MANEKEAPYHFSQGDPLTGELSDEARKDAKRIEGICLRYASTDSTTFQDRTTESLERAMPQRDAVIYSKYIDAKRVRQQVHKAFLAGMPVSIAELVDNKSESGRKILAVYLNGRFAGDEVLVKKLCRAYRTKEDREHRENYPHDWCDMVRHDLSDSDRAFGPTDSELLSNHDHYFLDGGCMKDSDLEKSNLCD